jgi:cyclophilin family peptidyl-prolyl cis-trans isomerase
MRWFKHPQPKVKIKVNKHSPFPPPLAQDGRHVVFGRVLEGMDVVYKVEAQGSQSGTPKSKVVIADSGELEMPAEGAADL